MEDKRLSGLLVSFFYDGSVFQEILQRKRNHQSIRSLEEFICDLQSNKCTNRKKLEDISKTVTAAVMINPQNNLNTSTCQSEYSKAIDAIFRFILNLPCMITWKSDIGGYFTNIPVPATQANEFIRSASLFNSLITGDLLKNHPTPALVLQLTRQESANVIPSLEIEVCAKTSDQQIERKKYCLQTIICLNSRKELKAYMRQSKIVSEVTWRGIKVKEWNNFIKIDLPGFEKQLRFIYNLKNLELDQDDRIAHHILYMMKKCIFLVYVPTQIEEEVHEAASSNVLVDLANPKEKAEQDNQPIEARQLQIGNMQITDDEVARSSLSIIPDEVETLIGICGPIPPQDPHLSSNLVDLNRRTEAEQRRSTHIKSYSLEYLSESECAMEDTKLAGLLASFFYEGSLFHETLIQKPNSEPIRILKAFISDIHKKRSPDRSDLKTFSKTIKKIFQINQPRSVKTWDELGYGHIIEAIFRNILSLPYFIMWTSKGGSYFHTFDVPPTQFMDFVRTTSLLCTQTTNKPLRNHPTPALVVHVVRKTFANVVPCLEVRVDVELNGKNTETRKYGLQTVICLNSQNEFVTYIRQTKGTSEVAWILIKLSEWNFFSLSDCPGFEKRLQLLFNLKNFECVQTVDIDKHIAFMMQKCLFLVYIPLQPTKHVSEAAACKNLIDFVGGKDTNPQAVNIEWKGIHGDENSCFLDSLLMTWLFYEEAQAAFLGILQSSLERLDPFDQATQLADVKILTWIINTIIQKLKTDPPYCEKSVIWELRKILSKHNPKMCGEMLDVTVFINVLFGSSLGADYFLTYTPIHDTNAIRATKQIGSYLHQIVIGRVEKLEPVDVETLLARSMKIQGIRFKVHPEPFLMIKLPLNNGKLVGVEYVIPSLKIYIKDIVEESGVVFEYRLTAIICLQDKYYTAFIRKWEDDWIYFDSMSPGLTGPEVEFLDGFTQDLMKGSFLSERNQKVQKILHKSCLYIYTRIPTSKEIFTDEKAEQENQTTEAKHLQIGNMQIADEEMARSSASVIPDAVETFIGVCEPNPAQYPHLSSNSVGVNRHTEAEQRRINDQTGITPVDVFAISECLLYLMQSYRTSLFHILRGINKKLKAKAAARSYQIPEDIQAITLSEFIDWNEGTPSSSLSPFCIVWNKLVEFAEGATSNNTCIELHVSVRWISVRKLYDNYVGRKETSPHGLVISIQRSDGGQEPVLIDTTISALTLKGKKTLQLFSVICFIKEEGLITFVFDSGKDCWTKKLANGKVQALERTDSYYLGFLPTEEINVLSDNEILQNHSIGIIYTNK